MQDHSDLYLHIIKIAADVAAIGIVVGTFVIQILPPIAAALSVFWGFTRAYEAISGKKFSESGMAIKLRNILGME